MRLCELPSHVHIAVTATSSLHAAGAVAGATVGLLHVFVEAFEYEYEREEKIN